MDMQTNYLTLTESERSQQCNSNNEQSTREIQKTHGYTTHSGRITQVPHIEAESIRTCIFLIFSNDTQYHN